jgi:hypothetical protein
VSRYLLYGLNISSDRRLKGLVEVGVAVSTDVRIRFGARCRNECTCLRLTPIASLHNERGEYLRVLKMSDDGYLFHFENGVHFDISADGSRVAAHWMRSVAFQYVTSLLLGPVLGFVLRLRGTVCLHASAVLVDGNAAAFLARGGSGKSSLCAYFAQRGHAVLTDDVLAIRRRNDQFEVLAGPARLRLRPDSVRHLFGTSAKLPRVLPSDPHSDKVFRDYMPSVASAPLSAIYTGSAGEEETPRVSPIAGRNAYLRLMANRFPARLPVPSRSDGEFHALTALAATVPIRHVHAPRNLHGLTGLYDSILADLRNVTSRAALADTVDPGIAG